MPHEQQLRKHLWEVRDCEVKFNKLQTSFEAAQLKTVAATKEEDDIAEAMVAVTKHQDDALAARQSLLSLCKSMQPGGEATNLQPES